MKKIISMLIALALLLSCVLSASAASVNMTVLAAYDATDERCIPLDDAVKAYEKENGVKLETYRNYFYIPDGTESFFDEYIKEVPTWFNEEFTDICIWYDTYNCKDAPCPESYCGFSINKTADKNIYYADIPVGVSGFLVNNGVTNTLEVYKSCNTAGFIGTGYNDAYNESYTNCDNMIYVHNIFDCYSLTHTAYFYGDWYYYYGNGCYGTVENGNKTTDCIRDDHHDDNGNHITNEFIIGDIDGDGEVSIMDATEIQLIVAKLKPMVESITVADADCDGQISVLDATAIQLKLAGIE